MPCPSRRTHHIYRVELHCQFCDRSIQDAIARPCVRDKGGIREVGCIGCGATATMMFLCNPGSGHRDNQPFYTMGQMHNFTVSVENED